MKKRLLTALCYTFGAIIISVMILFITWAVFKNVSLPYTQVSLEASQVYTGKVINPKETSMEIDL